MSRPSAPVQAQNNNQHPQNVRNPRINQNVAEGIEAIVVIPRKMFNKAKEYYEPRRENEGLFSFAFRKFVKFPALGVASILTGAGYAVGGALLAAVSFIEPPALPIGLAMIGISAALIVVGAGAVAQVPFSAAYEFGSGLVDRSANRVANNRVNPRVEEIPLENMAPIPAAAVAQAPAAQGSSAAVAQGSSLEASSAAVEQYPSAAAAQVPSAAVEQEPSAEVAQAPAAAVVQSTASVWAQMLSSSTNLGGDGRVPDQQKRFGPKSHLQLPQEMFIPVFPNRTPEHTVFGYGTKDKNGGDAQHKPAVQTKEVSSSEVEFQISSSKTNQEQTSRASSPSPTGAASNASGSAVSSRSRSSSEGSMSKIV